MANVNLKTDFKDGEFLYGDQLKNNFEAIQAALSAMNEIVWQDNADKVVTFRGTTEELMNREIIDGQILYDTTTGESYIDYEGKRISTGSGNAIHIGANAPTNPSTQLWINSNNVAGISSEVVNSLDNNEECRAPSVAVIKGEFNKRTQQNLITNGDPASCGYTIDDKIIYRKRIVILNLINTSYETAILNGELVNYISSISIEGYRNNTSTIVIKCSEDCTSIIVEGMTNETNVNAYIDIYYKYIEESEV